MDEILLWAKANVLWAIVVVIFILVKWGKPAYQMLAHFLSASKQVHETDALLLSNYEKKTGLLSGELAREQSSAGMALKEVARHKAKILEIVEELDIRKDVNKRERIARLIYLKHLRALKADIEAIEREIKSETERIVFLNGNDTYQ